MVARAGLVQLLGFDFKPPPARRNVNSNGPEDGFPIYELEVELIQLLGQHRQLDAFPITAPDCRRRMAGELIVSGILQSRASTVRLEEMAKAMKAKSRVTRDAIDDAVATPTSVRSEPVKRVAAQLGKQPELTRLIAMPNEAN